MQRIDIAALYFCRFARPRGRPAQPADVRRARRLGVFCV